jgi:hypothetical protein
MKGHRVAHLQRVPQVEKFFKLMNRIEHAVMQRRPCELLRIYSMHARHRQFQQMNSVNSKLAHHTMVKCDKFVGLKSG